MKMPEHPLGDRHLRGQRCVVTGASGGIGEAIADALLGQGAEGVVVARPGDRLEAACARLRLRHRGSRVTGFGCDLSLQGEVRALAAALGSGRVDVLVLNAALMPEPLGRHTPRANRSSSGP